MARSGSRRAIDRHRQCNKWIKSNRWQLRLQHSLLFDVAVFVAHSTCEIFGTRWRRSPLLFAVCAPRGVSLSTKFSIQSHFEGDNRRQVRVRLLQLNHRYYDAVNLPIWKNRRVCVWWQRRDSLVCHVHVGHSTREWNTIQLNPIYATHTVRLFNATNLFFCQELV